ncbi:MAG: hypothetical protein NZL92_06405 [Gloeomargarita sp. SKYG116]|nr:hypothetical protein [Gloeomargarita sp. SKYG116]MDW8401311.1 hypothetical protein [Gloeomargarita sp. SKYGB_i_bin116]
MLLAWLMFSWGNSRGAWQAFRDTAYSASQMKGLLGWLVASGLA